MSAAEHTVGMLLALVRKIPPANDQLKRLVWDRKISGVELFRKTVGRHNVNIASMHVGRSTRRGNAIVVLLLDEDVSPDVQDEVTKAVDADFSRVIRLGS